MAYSTCTGLGYQTKAYFDHFKPYRTLVTDISDLNHMDQHPEWYNQSEEQFEVIFDKGFPSTTIINKFLEGLDILLVAENPLNYWTFQRAKELGVKTVLIPNFEFLEYLRNPHLPRPDYFIVPSTWNIDKIKEFGPTKYLHFPVDRDKFHFEERKEFLFFLHNIGNKTYEDRNGTQSILDALELIEDKKVKVHINSPDLNDLQNYRKLDSRLSYGHTDSVVDNKELYKGASVLVLPRRYGGNCLPMNEALSLGMPVIMTDLEPQSKFLPKEWLVPAREIKTFYARTTLSVYEADAQTLADKMSWFANLSPEEFAEESRKADSLAKTISWEALLPQYEVVFSEVLSE